MNTGLLDTFIPLAKANYLDFIERFEADPAEALQLVCVPFTQPEDYSWTIYVKEQMIERYGTPKQLAEYRRREELRKTQESKERQLMGLQIYHFYHAVYVDHAWAASRTAEEFVGNHVRAQNSMTHGLTRMRRVISSTFRNRIWKSGLTGPGIWFPIPGSFPKRSSIRSWSLDSSCSLTKRRKPNEQ